MRGEFGIPKHLQNKKQKHDKATTTPKPQAPTTTNKDTASVWKVRREVKKCETSEAAQQIGAKEAWREVIVGQNWRLDCRNSNHCSAVPLPGSSSDTVTLCGWAPCQRSLHQYRAYLIRVDIPFLDLVGHSSCRWSHHHFCSIEHFRIPLDRVLLKPSLIFFFF